MHTLNFDAGALLYYFKQWKNPFSSGSTCRMISVNKMEWPHSLRCHKLQDHDYARWLGPPSIVEVRTLFWAMDVEVKCGFLVSGLFCPYIILFKILGKIPNCFLYPKPIHLGSSGKWICSKNTPAYWKYVKCHGLNPGKAKIIATLESLPYGLFLVRWPLTLDLFMAFPNLIVGTWSVAHIKRRYRQICSDLYYTDWQAFTFDPIPCPSFTYW